MWVKGVDSSKSFCLTTPIPDIGLFSIPQSSITVQEVSFNPHLRKGKWWAERATKSQDNYMFKLTLGKCLRKLAMPTAKIFMNIQTKWEFTESNKISHYIRCFIKSLSNFIINNIGV